MWLKVDGDSPLSVFAGLSSPDSSDELVIDMTDLRFVRPGLLSTVGAIIDYHLSNESSPRFVPPRNSDCCRYLERMNFGKLLEEHGVEHHLPAVHHHERASRERLCELARIDVEDYARLVGLVFNQAEELEVDAVLSDQLYQSLFELTDNCVAHAKTTSAFMSAQTYVDRIEFCVADMGRGILASFDGSRHSPSHHEAAITMAASMRISSVSDHRGIGLATLIRDVGRMGGSVSILSGNRTIDYIDGIPTAIAVVPNNDRGTIVNVSIPTKAQN